MTSLNETAEILRLYFIQQGNLALNGIGSFELSRTPAIFNEASGTFSAPQYTVNFTPGSVDSSKDLIVYLSKKKNISEPEAIADLHDFNTELNQRLHAGEAVQWAGIGSLLVKNQEIECIAEIIELPFQSNITVKPILPIAEPVQEEEPVTVTAEVFVNEEETALEAIIEEELVDADVEEEELVPAKKKNIYLILLAIIAVSIIVGTMIYHKGWVMHRSGAMTPSSTPEQFQSIIAE